jgi:hypothetical protein
MAELLIIGALARDQIRVDQTRWTQPGGAAWHAGLALAGIGGSARITKSVRVVGQVGPWAQAFALPALQAARGAQPDDGWLGPATTQETTFVNDYRADRRYQRLISMARPIHVSDLRTSQDLNEPGRTAAVSRGVVVSPLYREAVDAAVVAALVVDGAFVGVDAQGLLRRVGVGGVVETEPGDVEAWSAGASVLKFSEREFRVAFPTDDVEQESLRLAERTWAEVLVTAGDRGALLVGPDGSSWNTYGRDPGVVSVDSTGAGDVLLARYVARRAAGLAAEEALADAVDGVSTLLAARAALGTEERRAIVHLLRGLQGVATWAWRRLDAGRLVVRGDEELFAPDGGLARLVGGVFPHPVVEQDKDLGAGSRGPALLGACWALMTLGWPEAFEDAALLREILEAERAAASRVRSALLA